MSRTIPFHLNMDMVPTGLDLAPFLAQEVNLTSAAANNGIQSFQALNTHQSWDEGLPDYSCSKLVE